MNNNEEFEKKIKGKRGSLIAAIILFVISISTALTGYIVINNDMKNIYSLIDIKESGKYAKVDVSLMTDYFATTDFAGEEHKSYFVFDNDYIYIADLNNENREKLQEIYDYSYNEDENALAPQSVEIKGMTEDIPSDLRDLAIDAYNELYGEKIVNNSNYKDYFGIVYLDTFKSPMSNYSISLLACLPSLIIGIICLVSYLVSAKTTKKSKAKYADKWYKILEEVSNTDRFYKKAKLYLTRNFIISYQNGLEIFEYKDVVWVYPHEYRYNGSLSQKSVYVVTRNGKAHKLATVSASKKNLILFDELYDSLINYMPDVLKGYTKENIKEAKKLYEK